MAPRSKARRDFQRSRNQRGKLATNSLVLLTALSPNEKAEKDHHTVRFHLISFFSQGTQPAEFHDIHRARLRGVDHPAPGSMRRRNRGHLEVQCLPVRVENQKVRISAPLCGERYAVRAVAPIRAVRLDPVPGDFCFFQKSLQREVFALIEPVGPSQGQQQAGKPENSRMAMSQRPIQPGRFVVLAVGVVVSKLRSPNLIPHQEHGDAEGQHVDRQEIFDLPGPHRLARRILGPAPFRYRAHSPSRAVLYRLLPEEGKPFGKMILAAVTPDGEPFKVEFLAAGQQVVIHGMHQSGTRLRWAPALPEATALTPITHEKAKTFMRELREVLELFGYTILGTSSGKNPSLFPPPWAGMESDDDPYIPLLRDMGLLGPQIPGKSGFHVTCPRAHEHSERAASGAAYWLGGGFTCHHGSHLGAGFQQLNEWLRDVDGGKHSASVHSAYRDLLYARARCAFKLSQRAALEKYGSAR